MRSSAGAIGRFAGVFLAALVAACVIHELGHALAAWVQGIASVPTPLKAYVVSPGVRWEQEIWILFGGVAGTVLCSGCALVWYCAKPRPHRDAVFAGLLAIPLVYTLRFLLVGRGHDGVEWQAAQIVLGASPTGHLVDYVFLSMAIAGIAVWMLRSRKELCFSSFAKLAALMVSSFVILGLLQNLNNHLFDRYLKSPATVVSDRPADLDAR